MVTLVVIVLIVLDECSNRFLQFAWQVVGDEVNFPFDIEKVSSSRSEDNITPVVKRSPFTKLILRGRIDMISGGWLSGESACFTRKRSQVQILYRPP
jgi:hypothetical protein